jgi:NitT/TauT family transport system ATP-binding protein
LSLESVRIGYEADDETNLAVEDVSLEVWAGEKVMLLGPSGCGKSTLIKAIAGFTSSQTGVPSLSSAGRICVPDRIAPWSFRSQISSYPGEP